MKNIENKSKKTRKLKWYVKLLLLIIIIITFAFTIGTKGIFIKEYKIESSKITLSDTGLKILHFSDLHYGSTINMKSLKVIVKNINDAKADIVIFTGDLIDKNYKFKKDEQENVKDSLKDINASLGKYYVNGEEDKVLCNLIMNDSNFINIDTKEQLIYNNDNKPILLIGNLSAKKYFNENKIKPEFKILAMHNPNNVQEFKNYNFDIILAGHTHNGQINIFKLKDFIIKSKYNKPYQKVNNSDLFVSSGIGTSLIKARLFNHPTMNLYRIVKK
ncbi:MAG: metallophosphoesterase [Bacilli bacterium]